MNGRSENFHYGVKPKAHTLDRGTEKGTLHREYRSNPTHVSRPMLATPPRRSTNGGVSTAGA